MTKDKPYRNGPDVLGTFATRSPSRPNPVALDCSQVTYIDYDKGIIGLAWLDAFNGSPILDIKPYIPAIDRVETPKMPHWCSHWPYSYEESGRYDWTQVNSLKFISISSLCLQNHHVIKAISCKNRRSLLTTFPVKP